LRRRRTRRAKLYKPVVITTKLAPIENSWVISVRLMAALVSNSA
jgi:hypothetical protein